MTDLALQSHARETPGFNTTEAALGALRDRLGSLSSSTTLTPLRSVTETPSPDTRPALTFLTEHDALQTTPNVSQDGATLTAAKSHVVAPPRSEVGAFDRPSLSSEEDSKALKFAPPASVTPASLGVTQFYVPSYDMGYDVYGGGGGSIYDGGGGWSIGYNPYIPYSPPPMRPIPPKPSAADIRWSDAHSDAAKQQYAAIYSDIYGRPAQDIDRQYAADRIGDNWSVSDYRWNEAHTPAARNAIVSAYKSVANMDVTGAPILDTFQHQLANGSINYDQIRAAIANVHGRDAIVHAFEDVAQLTPSDAQIAAYKDALASGAANYQSLRNDIVASDAAANNMAQTYKNVYGVSPTDTQLHAVQTSVRDGVGLQDLRKQWAYSDTTAHKLGATFDAIAAKFPYSSAEIGEFARESWVFAQQNALAFGKTAVKSPEFYLAGVGLLFGVTEVAGFGEFTAFVARRVASAIAYQLADYLRENMLANTASADKIQLIEPSVLNPLAPFPTPTREVMEIFLGDYVQAGDFDVVGYIQSLPDNERLGALQTLTGQSVDAIEQSLILDAVREKEPNVAPDPQKVKDFPKLGQSGGGPGQFEKAPEFMKSKAGIYQEKVTGVPQGVVYKVKDALGKFVKFDGYDSERGVLQDAKLWKNWPNLKFSKSVEEVAKQLGAQLSVAKGIPVEWIVPDKEAAEKILQALKNSPIRLDLKTFSIRIQP